MVNHRFPERSRVAEPVRGCAFGATKPGFCSVNQSFSKSIEFSKNSQRIRFECAQKRERGVQACLLLVCHAAKSKQPRGATQTIRDRLMFFLLRMAFWLTIVLALLPTGSSQPLAHANAPQIDASDAVVAAGAAVSDMSGFCDRQPGACKVGAQAAVAIGQRAQAGATMVYDFIQERMARGETGSVPDARPARMSSNTVPSHPDSQTTLKPADLAPVWQGSGPRKESVPLPRPRAKQPV
jgi:hypothetical protein